MMEQLTCPVCSTPMSFVQFASSPTPFHLQCARCRSKLRVEKLGWTILVAAAALIAGLVFARRSGHLSNPAFFAAMIGAIFVVEIGAYVLCRLQGIKLVPRDS